MNELKFLQEIDVKEKVNLNFSTNPSHHRPRLSPHPSDCLHDSWLGGSVVERRSLTGELSLVCPGPAAVGNHLYG